MHRPLPAVRLRHVILAGIFGLSPTVADSAHAQSAAPQNRPATTLAGNLGSLAGTVVIDSSDTPIANAEIMLTDLSLSVRSDSSGRFLIANIPAGPHRAVVRQVGFEPFSATLIFSPGERVEADFVLSPVVTQLSDVRVTAASDRRYAMRLAEFEDRRRFGNGRFLTSNVFEDGVGRELAQVMISNIPGVRTKVVNGRAALISRRSGEDCPMQVLVNGLLMKPMTGEIGFDINSINTNDVIGLEFYTVATTPIQFTGTNAGHCGTVLVWTK
jgi:hypothetical protein